MNIMFKKLFLFCVFLFLFTGGYSQKTNQLSNDTLKFISDLKNSITMDFVSFEADSSTNKQKTLATSPPIISNLYQLYKRERL